ncbi:Bgt-20217 [Blumeria graminis f. sp. tritici]|uniref:Bgt-20217 n=2 Tax=Blumeria graminis f. sp. tritici TaxID=62690 RepID=A0A9X9QEA6_BLUGR|nr:Bgt-20217 [Blumeria graminis f. sp. tritici]
MRRKIPTTLVPPARVFSRAVKRARPRPPFPTLQEEVILEAAAEKQQSPAELIYMDSEDEFMDLGLENKCPSNSSSENLSLSPTPAPVPVTATQLHPPKKPLRRDSTQGISGSIYASTKDNVAIEQQPTPTLPRSSARATARIIEHPSVAMTNNIAASLLAWQNAGAQHLCGLPPTIAADFKAIVTRSAARVIAGLPVFEQS